jgi:hypothetical protein
MPDVFLSYASEDRPIAEQLSKMLQTEGQSVFFDHAIAAGEDYSRRIEEALTDSKVVVVLLSRNSNRSNWVKAELRSALQSGQVIIPVLLDEEATRNWVWPLLSDRHSIRIDSPAQIAEVVRQVNRAMGNIYESRSMKSYAAGSRWVILWVAVLSAVAGALVVWLTKFLG